MVILDQYKNGKIDRKSLIDILISIIENSDNTDSRIKSLEILNEVGFEDQKIFSILKELLISDEIELIRSTAAKSITNNFPNKCGSLIEWAIKYEISPQIISIFIESFKKDNEKSLGTSLIEYLRYILDNIADEKLENYIEWLKYLNDKEPFEQLDLEKLLEIYINFKIINYIDKQHKLMHYLLKEGYVIELALNTKKLSDLKGLEKLKKLEFLGLSGITEIDSPVNFPNLKYLVLDNSEITEIKGLDFLKNLELLVLEGNQIGEIKGLENLKELKHLNLSSNRISEIKGLENLTNLIKLYLNNNQIREIKGLETLTNLEVLYLDHNQISEIKSLENLKKVEILSFFQNKITEMKGLENLEELLILDLSNNKISESKELEKLVNLPRLEFIELHNNKISKKEIKQLNKNLEKIHI
ncbi:MAG: leucine-rich repeat domain-containing protein [Promethearchaeota archaeon]